MFRCEQLIAETFVQHAKVFEQVASTSDLALERARDSVLQTPALFIAERQTAGRGRGKNVWWSQAGGLTFSLVLEAVGPLEDQSRWPRIAVTTAVAVGDAVALLAPQCRCAIKWPNDVYLDGQKLAGILVEAPHVGGVLRRIVIGLGLNVNNAFREAPDEIRAIGTSLSDAAGETFDLHDTLTILLQRIAERLRQLQADDPQLSGEWQSRCMLRGRDIAITLGTREVRGSCLGIQADGGLLIETPTGTETLYGGEVVTW